MFIFLDYRNEVFGSIIPKRSRKRRNVGVRASVAHTFRARLPRTVVVNVIGRRRVLLKSIFSFYIPAPPLTSLALPIVHACYYYYETVVGEGGDFFMLKILFSPTHTRTLYANYFSAKDFFMFPTTSGAAMYARRIFLRTHIGIYSFFYMCTRLRI